MICAKINKNEHHGNGQEEGGHNEQQDEQPLSGLHIQCICLDQDVGLQFCKPFDNKKWQVSEKTNK